MSVPDLRALTTFVRTAELGSLSRAADAQQITPQAASKALAQLEQQLGVRLFHRTTRSLSLTEEGQCLLEALQPALRGLQGALQTVQHTREAIAGPLRIVGPRTVLHAVLGPVLDEFTRRYPEVTPEVQLDDRIGNWVEDRIDVGFRLGNPPQDGLVARRLFPMQLLICAAPSYLRRHGVPRKLADLAQHRCSGFRRPSDGKLAPWSIQQGDEVQDFPVQAALSTNDEAFELRAVLAGQVVAQLAVPTAIAHLRAGRLVPLLPEHMAEHLHLYVYYGSRTALPARVRLFIDLVVARLGQPGDVALSKAELRALARNALKPA